MASRFIGRHRLGRTHQEALQKGDLETAARCAERLSAIAHDAALRRLAGDLSEVEAHVRAGHAHDQLADLAERLGDGVHRARADAHWRTVGSSAAREPDASVTCVGVEP
jgi:hypothetical protein